MREYPSWYRFKAKYPEEGLQRARFEDLARALFCRKYGVKYGLFQFVNHAGNETETIVVGTDVIGFQAKFFEKDIDADNIIHSLKTARTNNPEQTVAIIYTNLTFGNPPKGKQKTKSQLKIENEARNLNLSIEWVTDKMILDQVALEGWIYEVFFDLDSNSNLLTFYRSEQRNTENVLSVISNIIRRGDTTIKIIRDRNLETIAEGILKHQHFVIYGEGGCGKTAIVKELYEKVGGEIPFCIRKAQTLGKEKVDDFFLGCNIEQFESIFANQTEKVFVIDSAERLQDIGDKEPLLNLLQDLNKNDWSIIFTCRSLYARELCDDLRYSYGLEFSSVSVDVITDEELENSLRDVSVPIPQNTGLRQLLCKLFYLNLYIQYGTSVQNITTNREFIKCVWDKKIKGANEKGGQALEREKCFLEIINDRVNNDCLFLDASDYDGETLHRLILDEIIGESEQGIFIAHDIYEEWGVERMIDKKWRKKNNLTEFFHEIGLSYVVRRTFRHWLSEKINTQIDEIRPLLTITNVDEISPLWADEVIVSILHSSYCRDFLDKNVELLLENDAKLFKRFVILLQLACKRIKETFDYNGYDYPIYIPEGSGWKNIIEFAYRHKETVAMIPSLHKLLYEWCTYQNQCETTCYAGLLALSALEQDAFDNNSWRKQDSYFDQLYSIICFAALDIQNELEGLVKKIIENKWNSLRDPYYAFVIYILTKYEFNILVIRAIPSLIIQLCELYLVKQDDDDKYYISYYDAEVTFGLKKIEGISAMYLVWPLQRLFHRLLYVSLADTLFFIVRFVNRSIKTYVSNVQDNDLEKVVVIQEDGRKVEQWGAPWLWCLYRGETQYAIPDVLRSMHLALEKFLLEQAGKKDKSADIVMDYLISCSKSVSLTAVVSSVVMAYPEQYSNFALTLFKALDFFHYDLSRSLNESNYNLLSGYDVKRDNLAIEEKRKSNALPHRKQTLENICVYFQYFRSKLSEDDSQSVVSSIYDILDAHYKTISAMKSGNEQDNYYTLLYRIDKRKHAPKATEHDGQIYLELCPQMPDDLRLRNENAIKQSQEEMRLRKLFLWSNRKYKREDTSCCSEYDQDIEKAISDSKEILKRIKDGGLLGPLDETSPYTMAGVLLRDDFEKLTDEQRTYCVSLVEWQMENQRAMPTISDGLESCAHALPVLVLHYPEKRELYKRYFLSLLRNRTPIGYYKRICDYAIEAIHEGNMWSEDRAFMDETLKEYMSSCNMSDIETNEIVLSILPYKEDNPSFDEIVIRIVPFLGKTMNLKHGEKFYNNVNEFSNAFARYVLHKQIANIEKIIKPLLPYICGGYELRWILIAFVQQENKIKRPDAFWSVWKLLYQSIVNLVYDYEESMTTYLLTDPLAVGNVSEWHSLRENDLWLYGRIAKDGGGRPVVLYSIVKALDSFVSRYVERGIEWVYDVIHDHGDLDLGRYEGDTVFYLEKILSKFILQNGGRIKQNNMLRKQLIEILTFMVERNSVHGYMMREKL